MTKCPRCVMKHLTTAYGLLQEEEYPCHQWLAIGQLVLAEWECPQDIMGPHEIREARLAVESSLLDGKSVEGLVMPLIKKVHEHLDSSQKTLVERLGIDHDTL